MAYSYPDPDHSERHMLHDHLAYAQMVTEQARVALEYMSRGSSRRKNRLALII
jgi:hypothetical protein